MLSKIAKQRINDSLGASLIGMDVDTFKLLQESITILIMEMIVALG